MSFFTRNYLTIALSCAADEFFRALSSKIFNLRDASVRLGLVIQSPNSTRRHVEANLCWE